MSITIIPVSQIFRKYEQQDRIAELNKKTPVKTIQNQVDRVTISSKARKEQVLSIARAVREASKNLSTESKKLDEIKTTTDTNFKPSSFSDRIMQKALDAKREDQKSFAEGVVQKSIEKSNELEA